MTIEDLLAPFKARAEAATKGPWHEDRDAPGEVASIVAYQKNDGITVGTYVADTVETDADAEFIAAARSDVPRLLQALDAVGALADELVSEIVDVSTPEDEAQDEIRDEAAKRIRAAVVAALEGGETHGKD